MKFILSFTLLVSFAAFAQKAKVLVIDPSIDQKKLQNYDLEKPDPTKVLPKKSERDEFFKNVKQAQSMDELGQDLFYMDLKSKPLPALMKKYPQFSEKELKALKGKR